MTAIQAIQQRLTYNEAQYELHRGQMSQREFDKYWTIWTWSTFRMSGVPGQTQDDFARRQSEQALHDRIKRCGAVVTRILS